MSNMSYCRFENTANDLADVENALSEMIDNPSDDSPVNQYEVAAAPRLFNSASRILQMLSDVMGATITVSDDQGGECDLEDFNWEAAFEEVQNRVRSANADDAQEAAEREGLE